MDYWTVLMSSNPGLLSRILSTKTKIHMHNERISFQLPGRWLLPPSILQLLPGQFSVVFTSSHVLFEQGMDAAISTLQAAMSAIQMTLQSHGNAYNNNNYVNVAGITLCTRHVRPVTTIMPMWPGLHCVHI